MPNNPNFFSDFSGGPPEGLLNPSRATDNFRGSMHLVGGSNPEDGMSPYDINPNNALGSPASMDTTWGIKTQADHIGGQVI